MLGVFASIRLPSNCDFSVGVVFRLAHFLLFVGVIFYDMRSLLVAILTFGFKFSIAQVEVMCSPSNEYWGISSGPDFNSLDIQFNSVAGIPYVSPSLNQLDNEVKMVSFNSSGFLEFQSYNLGSATPLHSKVVDPSISPIGFLWRYATNESYLVAVNWAINKPTMYQVDDQFNLVTVVDLADLYRVVSMTLNQSSGLIHFLGYETDGINDSLLRILTYDLESNQITNSLYCDFFRTTNSSIVSIKNSKDGQLSVLLRDNSNSTIAIRELSPNTGMSELKYFGSNFSYVSDFVEDASTGNYYLLGSYSSDSAETWRLITIDKTSSQIDSDPIFNGISRYIFLRDWRLTGSKNDQWSDGSFKIFPNPGSGIFQIEDEHTPLSIKIFNVLGECMYEESEISNSPRTLNLIGWKSGTYYVQVINEMNESLTKVLIVN